jgi:hypothetical protein
MYGYSASVEKIKYIAYLAKTLKSQGSKHEGMFWSILNSGNAGYHSVHTFLSSSVLCK